MTEAPQLELVPVDQDVAFAVELAMREWGLTEREADALIQRFFAKGRH